MPAVLIERTEDPADRIYREAGNLDDFEVFNNKVLVGLYMRGGKQEEVKTKGGVILPQKHTDEDQYQSKVGMVLKMGPRSFVDINDPPRWFVDQDDMAEGDWVFFRANAGFPVTLMSEDKRTGKKQELLCRLLDDVAIEGRTNSIMGPDRIY